MTTYILLSRGEGYCLAVYDDTKEDVRVVGEGGSLEELARRISPSPRDFITTSHAFTNTGFMVSVNEAMKFRDLVNKIA